MVYIALAQTVFYAAQAQVLEYFAPAFLASAGPFATATGSSILSLSCPPSTPALLVVYIAPAQAVSYAEEILSCPHMSDDVFLRQVVESNALLSLCQPRY